MNHNERKSSGIHIAEHTARGHLIPAPLPGNDEGLVLSMCAKPGDCKNCARKIPVQDYKFYRTQWLPVDTEIVIAAKEK